MCKKIDESQNKNKALQHKTRTESETVDVLDSRDINQMEYKLLKLESMKKSGLISEEEYNKIRKTIIHTKKRVIQKPSEQKS